MYLNLESKWNALLDTSDPLQQQQQQQAAAAAAAAQVSQAQMVIQ